MYTIYFFDTTRSLRSINVAALDGTVKVELPDNNLIVGVYDGSAWLAVDNAALAKLALVGIEKLLWVDSIADFSNLAGARTNLTEFQSSLRIPLEFLIVPSGGEDDIVESITSSVIAEMQAAAPPNNGEVAVLLSDILGAGFELVDEQYQSFQGQGGPVAAGAITITAATTGAPAPTENWTYDGNGMLTGGSLTFICNGEDSAVDNWTVAFKTGKIINLATEIIQGPSDLEAVLQIQDTGGSCTP